VPKVTPPSKKVTVPNSDPTPTTERIVSVKVMGWQNAAGSAEDASDVAVCARATVKNNVDEEEGLDASSPP
jgi:hypothetical protein